MSSVITLVHPEKGEVIVDRAQWDQKFPDGEETSGWDEATATAAGWSIKPGKRGRPAADKAE